MSSRRRAAFFWPLCQEIRKRGGRGGTDLLEGGEGLLEELSSIRRLLQRLEEFLESLLLLDKQIFVILEHASEIFLNLVVLAELKEDEKVESQ